MDLQERRLRIKQNFWMFTTVSAYTLSNAGNSCINSFYPAVAIKKGVSESVIGVILCLVYLPQLIFMLVNGKLLIRIGPVLMLKVGLLLSCFSTLALGLTDLITTKSMFVLVCICLKIIQGIGFSTIATVGVYIAAEYIPDRMSFAIGLLETGSGFGYAIGPLIGGFLNDQLGYAAPFVLIGGLQLVIFFVSLFSMAGISKKYSSFNTKDEDPKWKNFSIIRKYPVILVLLFIITFALTVSCVYDIVIPLYGSKYTISSSTEIGLYVLIPGIAYAIISVIVGKLVDQKGYELSIVIIGLLSLTTMEIVLACLKIYTEFSLVIFSVVFTIISFGCSICYVPILSLCKKLLCSDGIIIDQGINAFLSSAVMTFLIFGQFTGTAVAGVLFEYLGIACSGIMFSIISLILATACIIGMKESSSF